MADAHSAMSLITVSTGHRAEVGADD